MPTIIVNQCRHYYRFEGAEDRPVLMLAHSLGVDHGQWDLQAADLLPHFRVLRYDLRGHGGSEATPGDYTIEMLARDALALADGLGVERFAFCGLSIGGMIGQWLGAYASDRLTHLVLANTSPRVSDPPAMEIRRRTVLDQGVSAVVDAALSRFFSPAVLSAHPPAVASTKQVFLATSPTGYAGCCAAIRDMNLRSLLGLIQVPVLIVSGDLDVSMPYVNHAAVLVEGIRAARVVRLPAAHLSNLERPRSFTAALFGFLTAAPGDPAASGLPVRRAVLGDAHVDRAIAGTSDFNRAFQDLITRYAWGTIWTRPGLDYRTRRLLVLATTAALGRWEEFRLHVRTGLANELEPCDLEEVLLQTAIYAGVPAANTGFHIAQEEMG